MATIVAGCASGSIALSNETKSYLEGWWGTSDETHPSCPNSNDVGASGLFNGDEYTYEFRQTGGTVTYFDRIEGITVRYRILSAEERDGQVTIRMTGYQSNVRRFRLMSTDRFEAEIENAPPDFPSRVSFLKCSRLTPEIMRQIRRAVPDNRR